MGNWDPDDNAPPTPLAIYAERNGLSDDEARAVMVLGRPSTSLRKNFMKLAVASTSYTATLGSREPLDSV